MVPTYPARPVDCGVLAMSNNADITLCLTIGKRPNELRQTLESLFQFEQFDHIVAINDFGDDASNQVFKQLCPHGKLIDAGRQIGHHQAIDALYSHVETPYIFHCEDDWRFCRSPNFNEAKTLLRTTAINSVCFRKISDFHLSKAEQQRIVKATHNGIDCYRLDALHEQWYGFTFNPHLSKIDLWQSADSRFAQFKKERHISRWQKQQSRYAVFFPQGACSHIGDGISVSHDNAQPSAFKKLRKQLKTTLKATLKNSKNNSPKTDKQ